MKDERVTVRPWNSEQTGEIERKRKELSAERGGQFVGYNDSELDGLVGHDYSRQEGLAPGADGFVFGGETYPSVNAARSARLTPKAGDRRG